MLFAINEYNIIYIFWNIEFCVLLGTVDSATSCIDEGSTELTKNSLGDLGSHKQIHSSNIRN